MNITTYLDRITEREVAEVVTEVLYLKDWGIRPKRSVVFDLAQRIILFGHFNLPVGDMARIVEGHCVTRAAKLWLEDQMKTTPEGG